MNGAVIPMRRGNLRISYINQTMVLFVAVIARRTDTFSAMIFILRRGNPVKKVSLREAVVIARHTDTFSAMILILRRGNPVK